MIERQWKTIPSAINYDVSNYGEIRQNKKNKLLKVYISKNGYAYISLRDNNKKYVNKRVHRLVAEAFIPNPDNLPMVNHKDFNRSNNYVENLEWVNGTQNNLWSRERIKKSARNKKISKETRHKYSLNQISKSKNPYPTHITKTRTGYIFRIRRLGKNIICKQFPTLQQTIDFKEKWLVKNKDKLEF